MITLAERRQRKLESNQRGRRRKKGEDVPIVAPGRPAAPPRCPVCRAVISAVRDCNCPDLPIDF